MEDGEVGILLVLVIIATVFITGAAGGYRADNKLIETYSTANRACQFRRTEIAVIDGDKNIYCVERENLVVYQLASER